MISLVGNISLSHEDVLGIDAREELDQEWLSFSSSHLFLEPDAYGFGSTLSIGLLGFFFGLFFYLYHE
jgi:hypothetical protein